jgi:predicted secreted protein
MKVRHYSSGITIAKVMVRNPMYTADTARKQEVKQEYISRIVAKEDNKTVFDLITSEYLSKNPIIRFTYKSLGASSLNIETIDNSGHKENLTQTITEGTSSAPLAESKSTGKEGKPYRVNIPAITKTFGDIELIDTDRIQLVAPDVAANGGAVPVDVFSDIKAKSVTLFAKQEYAEMKFICQWRINEYSIIDYHVKLKLDTSSNREETDSNLMIIIEGEDGKFYTIEKKVDVALGGGN